MSFRKIKKTIYECHCECINADGKPCAHDWESSELPDRCAKCKRHTWNGTDRRVKVVAVPKKKKKAA